MGSSGDGVVASDFDFLVYFRLGLGPVGAVPADCSRISVVYTVRACWVVVGSVVRSKRGLMAGESGCNGGVRSFFF